MFGAIKKVMTKGKPLYREEGDNRQPAFSIPTGKFTFEEIEEAIKTYTWSEGDFLLATYPKNGTHYVWEIMMMLLRGSSEYVKDSKGVAMMEAFPCTKIDEFFPAPRVLNTHYTLDCLPEAFQGRKTVLVLRNPKDTLVSYYHHMKGMMKMLFSSGKIPPAVSEKMNMDDFTFAQFQQEALTDKEQTYGNHLDYMASLWKHKDQTNIHVVYFEDLKRNTVECITRLNEFMGTNCSPDLVADIADKTSFQNMKTGKEESEKKVKQLFMGDGAEKKESASGSDFSIYRKGQIGDWKNHFTVAENEAFDKVMEEWQKGKDIPFIYE